MKSAEIIRRIERVGGTAIIYEGAVLALRRVKGAPQLPAISDIVWACKRRSVRAAVGAGVSGYLFWHFMAGPRAQP